MKLARTHLFVAVSIAALLSVPAQAIPPIWEPSFGSELLTLTTQDDATTSVVLSFNFPYEAASYTTVHIGTNGCVQLGSLGTDGDIDYDHWQYFEEFIDDSAPELCPLNTDLDLTTTGTIHFNDFGDHAVVTWNEVGTNQEATHLSTFQVQLWNTGRIVFGYNGILDGAGEDLLASLDEGIVVGITISDNVDPGPVDLSNGPFSTGATAYERWCYDAADSCGVNGSNTGLPGPINTAFDLDQRNVIFDPLPGTGFTVSNAVDGAGPTAIPTLSQWSLMVLGALLALVGLRAHRRRAAG